MAVKPAGRYDPPVLEKRILAHWRAKGIAERTLEPHGGENYAFLEGPPTANAPPALHHVEMRVFKDIVLRYQYMHGKSVRRKAGWDCHGLPVEVQVEKKLQLNSKKDILAHGLDRFVEECRESVFSYIKEWDKLTERMAYWVDMEHPYVTMDNDYIESVWWSLAQLYEKGLLYEGHKVTPYCARCGTPLSSHEVALGYTKVKEDTVVVKFKLLEGDFKDAHVLAWTTTPWTLPSNVALAVHSDFDYAVFSAEGETYIMAEKLVEGLFKEYELLKVVKGRDLEGLNYEPLLPYFKDKPDHFSWPSMPDAKESQKDLYDAHPPWRVITGDFVTLEDGTGVVHIAPAFGEDDYTVATDHDIPLVNPVDEEGKFTGAIPILQGKFVKDTDDLIREHLESQGQVVSSFPYEHDYPFCWRCGSPLLYYALKSWFVRVADNRDTLLKNNENINWYPDHMKEGRFGNWLSGARDWALSRNRFWGTPLPIWECETCDEKKVIGSIKDLKDNSTKPPKKLDLHRPYVDEVTFTCTCGATMHRVPYVIDCWYDSGAAPFAQYHYPFENEDLFAEQFPYDFIAEATDQTRGWFYTLLVLASLLFDKPAYTNVVVGGLLVDDAGEKMSKSNGNIINPWELFDSVGADAVRLQMCVSAPWNVKRFGKESLNETVLPLLRTLWNCYEFTTRYLVLDNLSPDDLAKTQPDYALEDRWIRSRAASLARDVDTDMSGHNYHLAVAHINDFVTEDLSRWYIKLVRDRLWLEDKDGVTHPSKLAAYATLTDVFDTLTRVLAPFTPFICEDIYQNILTTKDSPESIHLIDWPSSEGIDAELETRMTVARKIFEAGATCRQQAGIKLRHPIAAVTVTGDAIVKNAVSQLNDVIKKQLNAKDVRFKDDVEGVSYTATPNFKVLGKTFREKANAVADRIRANSPAIKKAFDDGKDATIDGTTITPDMVADIRLVVPDTLQAAEFAGDGFAGVAYIDTTRSDDLLREALARDVIRNLQELRKKADLDELQTVTAYVSATPTIDAMLANFEDDIKTEVRAATLETKKDLKGGQTFTFEGEDITVDLAT